MESIKIAIAEDNDVIRNLLLQNFEQQEKVKVVLAAENGKFLLDMLCNTDVEIVLLDVNMPVMDGYETMVRLHILFPEIKVIMFSTDLTKTVIDYFKDLGAFKFLSKESSVNKIIDSICEVHEINLAC
jgi:DNA-binding NarL/FixJ family response regulator